MIVSLRHLIVFSALAMAALAPVAYAAEDSFVIADASGPSARFISLQGARNGLPARVGNNGLRQAPALRSDRAAMNNGFMRIDRALLRPTQSFSAHSASKQAGTVAALQPVKVQRGGQNQAQAAAATSDEAADLFAALGANEPTSFREALSGATRNIGGAIRHAWPLPASANQRFTSGYGMRADPFHGQQRFHGGIDIAAPVGTPILASAEGTVSKVEQGKGLGKFVAVQHRDGSESYYGHLNAQNVRVGQHVMQGQKIGELGSTGRSTGPHLDYRIKKNGQTVNPMAYLRAPSSVAMSVASR